MFVIMEGEIHFNKQLGLVANHVQASFVCVCSDENYLEYKKRTSALPLVPPAVYRRLPYAVKCLCCCEFPLYDYTPADEERAQVNKDFPQQNTPTEEVPRDPVT